MARMMANKAFMNGSSPFYNTSLINITLFFAGGCTWRLQLAAGGA